jgi:ABC-2 type transport system ATP-binding protein
VFILGVEDRNTFPEDELRQMGYNVRPTRDRFEITLKDGQSIDPVLQLIRDKGLRLTHMVEKRQTLEDIFVSLVEAAEPGVEARRKKRLADRDRDDRDRGRGRDPYDDRYRDDDRRDRGRDY